MAEAQNRSPFTSGHEWSVQGCDGPIVKCFYCCDGG